MEAQDKKEALLLEILKIYDKCKCRGTWIYIIFTSIYFICSLLYIFFNNPIITIFVFINTAILIFLICREENYQRKKGNNYDQFYSEVNKYSFDKLCFLKDYIEYLLAGNKTNNNGNFIVLVFIPFMIGITANEISQIVGQCFWLKLIGCLFIGIIFVSFYNLFPYTFNPKILKLIRVKRRIEYALLCKRVEKIE